MKDDKLYLIHILECIGHIEDYCQKGREEFLHSRLQQDAVMRNFEIMGEATKHISDKLKKAYATIPWKRIAGFRDVLIHNYMGVEVESVWQIIDKDLPGLKRKIQRIRKTLEE